MSGRFLLDTNIVIAIFAEDSGVMDHLAQATEVLKFRGHKTDFHIFT